MILVLNPLQLLSGSKVVRLFLLTFLISCCTYAIASTSNSNSGYYKSKQIRSLTKVLNQEYIQTGIKDSLHEITFRGRKFLASNHKKSFKIAVILPFHSDAQNSPIDKKRANVMLEYYQGIKAKHWHHSYH